MEAVVPEFSGAGVIREPSGTTVTGIVPTNTYRCKNGKYVVIGGNGDSIFQRLMQVAGHPEMASDPRMANNAGRVQHDEHPQLFQNMVDLGRGSDPAIMLYTSGTTGHPKGCMHTHRSVMYNTIARHVWLQSTPDTVMLAVLPFFHVTGMQNALNGAIYLGATAVLIPRWDRDVALQCIGRYKVTAAQLISTMVVDMLSHPNLDQFDLVGGVDEGTEGDDTGCVHQPVERLVGGKCGGNELEQRFAGLEPNSCTDAPGNEDDRQHSQGG